MDTSNESVLEVVDRTLNITRDGLVKFVRTAPSNDVLEKLKDGVPKRLIVLFKPFGEDKLSFYDQNSRLICDADTLASDATTKVICTNQRAEFDVDLVGTIIFAGNTLIRVHGAVQNNRLQLVYPDFSTHTFHDQFSLLAFPTTPDLPTHANLS